MKRWRPVLLLSVAMVALCFGAAWYFWPWRSPRSSSRMTVRWECLDGDQGVIGRVVDRNGDPVAGQVVDIETDSGRETATSDAAGRFKVGTAEPMIAVEAKGIDRFEWPLLLSVSTVRGLDMEIVLKRVP